jgi:hypothetical protein
MLPNAARTHCLCANMLVPRQPLTTTTCSPTLVTTAADSFQARRRQIFVHSSANHKTVEQHHNDYKQNKYQHLDGIRFVYSAYIHLLVIFKQGST